MLREVMANEPDATRRRSWFFLMNLDGSVATGEAGKQPVYLNAAGTWINTGLGVLLNPDGTNTGANAKGLYYAVFTQAIVETAGRDIETSFESLTCPQQPGDTLRIVEHDPFKSPATILFNGLIENDVTLKQGMQILLAGVAGKSTGAGGATEVLKAANGEQTRMTVAYDVRGNRTSVTFDFTP